MRPSAAVLLQTATIVAVLPLVRPTRSAPTSPTGSAPASDLQVSILGSIVANFRDPIALNTSGFHRPRRVEPPLSINRPRRAKSADSIYRRVRTSAIAPAPAATSERTTAAGEKDYLLARSSSAVGRLISQRVGRKPPGCSFASPCAYRLAWSVGRLPGHQKSSAGWRRSPRTVAAAD